MAEICHLNRELLQSLYDKLNGGVFYENHDEDMTLVGQLLLALAATPKTPRLAIMAVAQQVVDALEADRKSEGYDLEAGMFGPAFSNLMRKWAALEYAAQPATGRADFATEAEGDAFILGWFEGQGWGFPSPRDESTRKRLGLGLLHVYGNAVKPPLAVDSTPLLDAVDKVLKLMGLKHTPECLELRLKALDVVRNGMAK